jgi:actin-like ATPase involved in cell morphogenesis
MKKIIMLLMMLIFAGCVTVSVTDDKPAVTLTNKGRIYVGDKYAGLKNMVRELKSAGYEKAYAKAKKREVEACKNRKNSDSKHCETKYRIVVQIPRNTSQNALKAISRELASAGYDHILFKQERTAIAQVGPDPLIQHLYQDKK